MGIWNWIPVPSPTLGQADEALWAPVLPSVRWTWQYNIHHKVVSELHRYCRGYAVVFFFFFFFILSFLNGPIAWWRVTGIPCFIAFCWLPFAVTVFFPEWRFVATLPWASVAGAVFLKAFADFMSLCHFVVILPMFPAFSLCLLQWLVIGDQRSLMLLF